MNATRTDIHRPSATEFDPQAYDLVDVFDADDVASNVYRNEIVSDLLGQGYTLGHGNNTKCGHCGANIRYSALLVRDDVEQFIFVGETCLDNRFKSLTKSQFQALREAARLSRERRGAEAGVEALSAEHACVRRLVAGGNDVARNYFLTDVRRRLLETGRLSDRQIAAVGAAFARDDKNAEWAAKRAVEKAAALKAGVKAPAGRVEVVGTVVSVKHHDSRFGTTLKATVKSDAGWLVWVTLPAGLTRDCVGTKIKFTATVAPSERDPLFGFATRPTPATVVA